MLTAMGCPMDLTGTIVLHRWSQAWELVQATTRQVELSIFFHFYLMLLVSIFRVPS